MTTITSHIQPVLDAKRIPAALLAAFFVQTAGVLFWAGSVAERVTVLERTVAEDQTAIEKFAAAVWTDGGAEYKFIPIILGQRCVM